MVKKDTCCRKVWCFLSACKSTEEKVLILNLNIEDYSYAVLFQTNKVCINWAYSGKSIWQINWIHAQTNKLLTFTRHACTVPFLLIHNHYKYGLFTIQSISYLENHYLFIPVSFIWKIFSAVGTHKSVLHTGKSVINPICFAFNVESYISCTP